MRKLACMTVVCGSLVSSLAGAESRIEEVDKPKVTAPLASWTPVQQWMDERDRGEYGYRNELGWMMLADELGDRLSELGRASLINLCFERANPDATSALRWAACGHDVGLLDAKKAEQELVAAGISAESRAAVMKEITDGLALAKKIGAAVEAEAKADPGIAAVLKLGTDARAEWAAYLGKNREAFARYVALKDAVRSGKRNDPGFAGCDEATRPAFARYVKASRVPLDLPGHPMVGMGEFLGRSIEGYVASVSYAACAVSVDQAGESPFVAVANVENDGQRPRAGARALTVAKAFDGAFAPRFADRNLRFDEMRRFFQYGIQHKNVLDRAAIMTPSTGVVASLKKKDDVMSTVIFKSAPIEACLRWVDSKKVAQINGDGSIRYERSCAKRGKMPNTTTPVDVPTRYAHAIAAGNSVVVVMGFPVMVWKGKKVLAVWGVPAK